MTEFTTVLTLAKDVKGKINAYNEAEPSTKKSAYEELQRYIDDLLSIPQNRSLIYRGNNMASVFVKTLGKWRMEIWKELTE